MFDVGASEFLLIVIVAIVVIGPKDLPRALRMAGQWIAKVRRVSGHFRSGIETMIREAELAEMEQKWREQNEAVMKAHPAEPDGVPAASAEAALLPPPESQPEPEPAPAEPTAPKLDVRSLNAQPKKQEPQPEPQLPFPPP